MECGQKQDGGGGAEAGWRRRKKGRRYDGDKDELKINCFVTKQNKTTTTTETGKGRTTAKKEREDSTEANSPGTAIREQKPARRKHVDDCHQRQRE